MKGKTARILFTLTFAVFVLASASCGKSGGGSKNTSSGQGTAPKVPASGSGNTTGMPLTLPSGFSISIFADGLKAPRVLIWDSAGNLLVSDMGSGQVLALPDRDNNGVADEKVVVADGLNNPHGLAFLPSDATRLYIAETDQVAVYDYDRNTLKATGKRKIIDLPPDGEHITRTIMFMPPPNEDKLLISVGSSENVIDESDWRRAKILVANSDGSGLRTFASGLRNSVFMAVRPATKQVWATENGRDYLGDNLPPDEINIIEDGRDYGWPDFYGKNIHDTTFDKKTYPSGQDPAAGMTPSYIDLQAHSAPLGLAFIDSANWPADYKDDLLVCFHGSWNRSVPTGDKVVRVRLDRNGRYRGIDDFITGWLQADGTKLGRPVGILFKGDGSAYISDDQSGVIYRVTPP
jgi:glucose/arabinose dehydrogenase